MYVASTRGKKGTHPSHLRRQREAIVQCIGPLHAEAERKEERYHSVPHCVFCNLPSKSTSGCLTGRQRRRRQSRPIADLYLLIPFQGPPCWSLSAWQRRIHGQGRSKTDGTSPRAVPSMESGVCPFPGRTFMLSPSDILCAIMTNRKTKPTGRGVFTEMAAR